MFVRLFSIFLVSLGLFACKVPDPYGPVPKALALKVQIYEDVVRWGDLRKAYAFGKISKGQNLTIPQNLDNVRVTHYEATQVKELSPWRWGQTANIAYVLKDRQVVKEILDQQVWMSDDEGKSWYRANPVPAF